MNDTGYERVATLDDLAEGVPVAVDLGRDEQVCLVKFRGEVYAFSNSCSHADFSMSDGELVDDFIVECGLHGAQFDIRDGSVLEPPATEPLTCYDVKVVNGDVLLQRGGISAR